MGFKMREIGRDEAPPALGRLQGMEQEGWLWPGGAWTGSRGTSCGPSLLTQVLSYLHPVQDRIWTVS